MTSVASTKQQVIQYHLARLLGYLVLGSIAGLLGSTLIGQIWTGPWSWAGAILVAIMMFFSAIRAWKGRSFHLPIPTVWQGKMGSWISKAPALGVGLASALLPCGWLYTFVLAAVASGGTLQGISILFAFWLGTLPALSALPWVVRSPRWSPRVSAVVLFSAGVLTLFIKIQPLIQISTATPSVDPSTLICH